MIIFTSVSIAGGYIGRSERETLLGVVGPQHQDDQVERLVGIQAQCQVGFAAFVPLDRRPFSPSSMTQYALLRPWRNTPVQRGSDSPMCTLGGPLASWVAATLTLVQGASTDEKANLFHANAARIWGLPRNRESGRRSEP
ncbi:MAG: hypothetical protein OET44_14955 [Gammaproteobacteria bacterium]|nr:hypothetical protein [Gammaproteobacteria bacterium]